MSREIHSSEKPTPVIVDIVFARKKIKVTPEIAKVHVGQAIHWRVTMRDWFPVPLYLIIYFSDASPLNWTEVKLELDMGLPKIDPGDRGDSPHPVEGTPRDSAKGDYKYGVRIATKDGTVIDDEDPIIRVVSRTV